jgi:hypothetical protein
MATTAFVSPQALVLFFLFLLPSPLSPALALSTIHSRPKIGASTPCTACTTMFTSTLFPRAMGMPNHQLGTPLLLEGCFCFQLEQCGWTCIGVGRVRQSQYEEAMSQQHRDHWCKSCKYCLFD